MGRFCLVPTWARSFGLAVAQHTLFLVVVLGALYLLRRTEARIRYVVAMIGFVKLLLPLFVPGPDLFSTAPPPGDVSVDAVVVEPAALPPQATPSAPQLSLAGALFILWACGALVSLLLPVLHTARLLHRLRLRTTLSPWEHKPEWRPLRVFASPLVSLPLSVGLRCRTVFVPPEWQGWPARTKDVTMYHELAHAARGDSWAQLAQVITRAIYFFHPFVWVLYRLAEDYREMACDDRARQAAQVSAVEYTRQLQQLAGAVLGAEHGSAGVTALLRQRNRLLRRVQYQMEDKAMRKAAQRRALAVVVALALLVFSLSFYCGKKAPQADTGTIKGFVTEAATGTRIAGARIALVGTRLSARTDENGEFAIPDVPPGTYIVEAQAAGYHVHRIEAFAVQGNTVHMLALNLPKSGEPAKQLGTPPVVFVAWDEPPEPIGGFQAIQANLRYPEEVRKAGIEGKVYVIAVIDSNGTVRQAYAQPDTTPAHLLLEKAALEAVSNVAWKPARKEGRPVAVQIGVPVMFKVKGGIPQNFPCSPALQAASRLTMSRQNQSADWRQFSKTWFIPSRPNKPESKEGSW
ncbi:MAG: M56 family metallopeptidase [bacterium]|nr:M56 family metallopeptidase [candidate division KSB1 bacterium]MDH7561339.1 M56 family metallopeptidase [bacterium]